MIKRAPNFADRVSGGNNLGTGLPSARRIRWIAALTLPELVISVSIMSVLLGGIGSAMLLAGKSIPASNAVSTAEAEAARAIALINSELAFATSISSISTTLIEYTVPDRGHGAAGAETIRYEWSGTPGDPILRTYNGGAAVSLVSSASSLTITPQLVVGEIPQTLRVLLVAANADSLSTGDAARKALLESWGMTGAVIDDDATLSEFLAAARDCDVVYLSHAINSSSFRDKAVNLRRGVVIESFNTITDYGLGSGPAISLQTAMTSSNSTHPITLGMSGSKSMVTAASLMTEFDTPTAAATVLGATSAGKALLVVADLNTTLEGGTKAGGRRVKPPGGVLLYSVNALTNDGKKVLARSLAWAGAPIQVAGVRVQIQTPAGSAREVTAQLLNRPVAPAY